MPIRFASEAWPRPGLAEPRSASIPGKDCHDQGKQVHGLVLASFLAPQTDMIFGDGVGASLV